MRLLRKRLVSKSEIARYLNKKLALLGDSIINCVVSSALSLFYEQPYGVKVKDESLRKAWIEIFGRDNFGTDLAYEDLAEALIAYLWLVNVFSIEDYIKIISHSKVQKLDEYTTLIVLFKEIKKIIKD